MNGSGHFILGCGAGVLVMGVARGLGVAGPSDTAMLAGIMVAGVGSLGPDVDCEGSALNRTAPLFLVAGIVLVGLIPGLRVTLLPQFLDSWWLKYLHDIFPLFNFQVLAGWTLVAFALTLVIAPQLVSHRGPTHSLAFTLLLTMAVLAIYHASGLPLIYGWCFGAGWASHLIADAFTEEGLPEWDWPLAISSD